jgi:hypothetical protein
MGMIAKASDSRFKLFSRTIDSRVRISLIALETARLYYRFRYSPESSTFFRCHVMREKGIDLSVNKPKLITNQMVQEADMIIVMGYSAQGFFPILLISHMKMLS